MGHRELGNPTELKDQSGFFCFHGVHDDEPGAPGPTLETVQLVGERATILKPDRYSNTIRDLLGVSFGAEKHLPADDYLADVLTVSTHFDGVLL
jgi:hypothetical protein